MEPRREIRLPSLNNHCALILINVQHYPVDFIIFAWLKISQRKTANCTKMYTLVSNSNFLLYTMSKFIIKEEG